MRPEHLGIEYKAERWQPLYDVGDVEFEEDLTSPEGWTQNVVINDVLVGSLERRPHYCDRGRWMFRCDLPDLDGQDGFPRYYMNIVTAKIEIITWLNWRLWRRYVS